MKIRFRGSHKKGLLVAAALASIALAVFMGWTLPRDTLAPLSPSPTPLLTPTPVISPAADEPTDRDPPYIAGQNPAPNSTMIPKGTQVILYIQDDGAGVDRDSIRLTVNGSPVSPFITGGSSRYVLVYTPTEDFSYNQIVNISVSARDLASPANRVEQSYSFTIMPKPKIFPPVVDPEGNLRLSIVFYGKHGLEEDERILKVRPQYIIANTPHSLWGEAFGYDTWWLLHRITDYQAAGIKVIGYITAGYEGNGSGGGMEGKWYTLEMNRKLIKNMAEMDKVDGVFIDECSAYPNAKSKQYLKELTEYAHSYGLITWGNVGSNDFDPWFFTEGGFDMMKSTEEWHGQELTTVQQEWGERISVTGFQASYSDEDAYRLTVEAWEKGLAYCYISNDGYDTLPPWLASYTARLRSYQPPAGG